MNELVIMKSKQALTTSLKVAETFSKEHKVVMRAIKNLAAQNCTVEDASLQTKTSVQNWTQCGYILEVACFT